VPGGRRRRTAPGGGGEKYTQAQRRYRTFWYEHLGTDRKLRSVTADKPLAPKTVNEWWRDAEEGAGVPHVDGRGIHGIKGSVTTLSKRLMGSLGAAAGQSGTTEATLEKVYADDDPVLKQCSPSKGWG